MKRAIVSLGVGGGIVALAVSLHYGALPAWLVFSLIFGAAAAAFCWTCPFWNNP
jgi:hypothetical protein